MTRFIVLVLLALALPAGAQERFPDKPVRFIVPFPPGGGTDSLARILGAKLAEMWEQQVLIENRAGAQGNIGTAAGAKAAADGYTITLAHQGALVINPHLYGGNIGYDAVKDFAPLARATEMAFILVVHPSVPANSMKELARAREEKSRQARLRLDLFRAADGGRALPARDADPDAARALQGRRARRPPIFSPGM